MNAPFRSRLYLFCCDSANDRVAPYIFAELKRQTEMTLCPGLGRDGVQVLMARDREGGEVFFAEMGQFPCAIYPELAPWINANFPDCEMVGLVNWHQGGNAPDKIFCAHSTADVPTSIFGPTDGVLLHAVLCALEAERVAVGLHDWRTMYEASHWSGQQYGRAPAELLTVKAPVFDIEIGSQSAEWANPLAHQVMARSILRVARHHDCTRPNAIFIGGIHFEPSVTQIEFEVLNVSHHLPNQWMVSGGYDAAGSEARLVAAAKSCAAPVDLVIYHDSVKSVYKEAARKLAAILGVPACSHKKLRAADWRLILSAPRPS